MRRTGLVDLIGEEHWFLSDEAAVAAPFVDREAETDEPPRRRPGRGPGRSLASRALVPTASPATTTIATTASASRKM